MEGLVVTTLAFLVSELGLRLNDFVVTWFNQVIVTAIIDALINKVKRCMVEAMPKKRPYDQFCPIARALDIVGDRWSMLIVRELFLGPTRYGELLAALETVSTDVLAKRLRELESTEVIERLDDGAYQLAPDGRDLAPVLLALGRWGSPRLEPPTPDDLTAARTLQMLVITSTGIDFGVEQTIDVRAEEPTFAVTTGSDGLVAHRGPSAEPDATITTDPMTLWSVSFGQLAWSDAVTSGALQVDGDDAAAQLLFAGRRSS